jgi:hypothetical protein
MRPISITRQLPAPDADGVCEAQTTTGPADLSLNGALVDANGVAQLGSQRFLDITSGGNLLLINFRIEGTTDAGDQIFETIVGPNNTTVTTVQNFATVTRISVDALVGSTVTIGTQLTGASAIIVLDQYISPFQVSVGVEITGTVNVTLQYTFDDIFGEYPGPFAWTPHPDITNITADDEGTFISPVTACRLLTNSGTGTAVLRVAQAGLV